MQSSRKPGIGVDRLKQIGTYLAAREPRIERLPGWWRMGGRLMALDRTSADHLRQAYKAAGGQIRIEDRSPLGYDMDANLFAFVGDILNGKSEPRYRQLQLAEMTRGAF